MDKIEKLQRYRDEIHNYRKFDRDFAHLIGIKLYDFIYDDDYLKIEFTRRLNYLSNLAQEKDFIKLQDSLFNTVQKILQLITIEDIEKAQARWNNKIANYFKTKKGVGIEEDIWLTLPEIYYLAMNKANYYRLGDNGISRRFNEEVSRTICIMAIKDQYTVNIDRLLKEVFYIKVGGANKMLENLYSEYNGYLYELDDLMYCTPVKLNVSRFEEFIIDCAKFHKKKDYEFFYSPSLTSMDEQKFQKTRITAMSVIDDLIEFLIINPSNNINKSLKNKREIIRLEKLGVIIDGYQIKKDQKKIKLDPTDEGIIYFLYLKHKENASECFNVEVLKNAVNGASGTVRNSISKINKNIKVLVARENNKIKIKIGNFIVHEPSRGYHLNSKHF